ncbi:MAG TPA: hypothetical protein VEJ46_12695 [Candidatus Acidoferrum sp.]|nr:hypothetical protein [Candidatus Acidoferrum sp.]
MNPPALANCRRGPCTKSIPAALASEQLCLDHFLDEAFVRTNHTFVRCREGHALTSGDLEWLLTDALAIVKNLEEEVGEPDPDQRERMLDLLLMLANLHEYVAHHSVRLDRPA